MVQITEVSILSIDKGDESWAIEGEILFEEDLMSGFEATLLCDEQEIEDLCLEIDPGRFDTKKLNSLIISAAKDFEE